MKNSIIINSITLINFKGVKNKTIEFKDTTNIFGANATGKTTIFDGFVWGLFGKDSTDRKDFEIKTLNQQGKTTQEIEVEVKIILTVNGEQVTIQRILKENWVKKRGSETREFSGNVTEFYWNGVPMQLREFQLKISSILEESVFKLITNPLAFNSLNWKDRRNILISMAPTSQEELAAGNVAFEKLLNDAKSYKDLTEYGKMIAASITKAKSDLKEIPARIDEVNRSKPEALNFDALRVDLETKNKELAAVDTKIQDKSAALDGELEIINSKKRQASTIKTDLDIIEDMARKQAESSVKPDTTALDGLVKNQDAKKGELSTAENTLNTLQSKINSIDNDIAVVDKKMLDKRNEWETENAKAFVFDDQNACCNECKRAFDVADVEAKKAELFANFKANKNKALAEINTKGISLKEEKELLVKEKLSIQERMQKGTEIIDALKVELKDISDQIQNENDLLNQSNSDDVDLESIFEKILSENPTYKTKKQQLEEINASIGEVPTVDNAELIEQRKLIIDQIDNIKGSLNIEIQINSSNDRIEQLQEEEKTLSQKIASVEKEQFIIESFNKLCIETLEQKINERFKIVQFKMFNTLINGGTEECCEALINGVPFSDANTASKINAGIDIINTLCKFYETSAPIFIDSRESVTSLIETESQIISLIVSESDKILRVA